MSRSPNREQILAIEHTGGVLLRAGAGSGKTFVLVEHIIYLTKSWIAEYKQRPGAGFEEFIRVRFSQVVMMTFTKKAAGEMSIRLLERFESMVAADSDDKNLWMIANEALNLLMVTTIDGFCRKLISKGFFPHLSTEAKIIFFPERVDQVQKLLDSWMTVRSETLDRDIKDIIFREKKDLLHAFCNVFSDPGLRLAWRNFSLDEVGPEKLDSLLKLSSELNGIPSSLQKILSLEIPHESERSSFEKFVAEVQGTGLHEVDSVEKLKNYTALLEGRVLRGESGKKKTPHHEAAKEGLSELRDWGRAWAESIQDYVQHFETKIRPWVEICQDLFNWIDLNLDPNEGMTFGDIEYHVSLALDRREDRDRVQSQYQYFIVDEFQDTSDIQFRIIQKLIGSDYQKLFCVGDAKQAIYGFRGGELSVFQDCAELVPKVLGLSNNYRSFPEIIHFNNSLFRTILPLGQEFKGIDAFTVKPEDQMVPMQNTTGPVGKVEILSFELERDLEKEGKFSTEDINRIEAKAIAQSIEIERTQNPLDVCTVLYSKLRPSGELIRFLMELNIGFTAQFKIDLMDDPIVGIFVSLLRRIFDKNAVTKSRYPLFMLENYLHVLGIPQSAHEEDLKIFDQDVNYWGLLEAFKKFIHRLGLTNENSDINLGTIETLSTLYHQDPEAIMIQLLQGEDQRVNLELRSGQMSHMVQIMTAHASKGLEFDTVYLAGIYTNGKEIADGPLFGNRPGSFKWYLDLGKRLKQKSPFYIFETELSRYKNFSESKRLFYVACTRAKKKLKWVELNFPEKSFSIPKNSWIDGLKVWEDHELAKYLNKNVYVHKDGSLLKASVAKPQLPLFFHDPMGIHFKGIGESELAIAAELSVTRLNSLLDCPRKFYFENTLKIKADPVSRYVPSDDEEEIVSVISSADRGTSIHAFIAEGMTKNFIPPRRVSPEEVSPVQWALDQLKPLAISHELVPEKQVKFKFFNFMISGIPDLVILPKAEGDAQVWDFKTGRSTQENLAHYWLQLSIYAYALFTLGKVSKDKKITLVLCFVDQKKTYNQSITWNECYTNLYPIWRSQNDPWKTNLDHCAQCSYGSICPR